MRPDDWRQDLSDSARGFIDHVWPVIGPWLGGGDLLPVEKAGSSDLLDLYAGIDAWHIENNDRRMRGIASRVQRAPHLYASFTIRSRRTSGAETELAKRVHALHNPEQGWLLPAITAQAYIDHQGMVGVGVAYTRDLYLLIDQGQAGRDYEVRRNGADGNEFYAVWWETLRERGIRVKTMGEERLADYSHRLGRGATKAA